MNTSDLKIEKEGLITEAENLLKKVSCNSKDDLRLLLEESFEKIKDFRLRLAYNRATEALESKLGWTAEFQEINTKLEAQLNKFGGDTNI